MASVNKFSVPALFSNSRYIVKHDVIKCDACGNCSKACPVGALRRYDDRTFLDHKRCIGCGVCVTRCKSYAIDLIERTLARPIPENYGRLFADMAAEVVGVQRFIDPIAPGVVNMFGDLLHKGLKKM